MPHVPAADPGMISNQLKNETIRNSDRGAEHQLGSVSELRDIHFASFSFLGGRADPRNNRCDMRQIQLVRCDSSPHRWETACPPGLRRAGEGPACGSLALPFPPPSAPSAVADRHADASTIGLRAADNRSMSATIDDRLLERWEVSRRHQDEARRFLARQKLSDPRGETPRARGDRRHDRRPRADPARQGESDGVRCGRRHPGHGRPDPGSGRRSTGNVLGAPTREDRHAR